MGHSSLVGIDIAPLQAAGRDSDALGPSDSSDSGSDLSGSDELDTGDPGQPVDVALERGDLLAGGGSDAGGTGERRSAAADGGRDAGDISIDRVFDPNAETGDDGDDPDLALVEAIEASSTPQPGRPNPEPDPPEDPSGPAEAPLDDEDREERKPGRS